jgi:hypothetical protein
MATRRYKISPGMTEFQIIEEAGAAVNSNVIELTVELADSVYEGAVPRKVKKGEVLLALEMLQNHILKNASGQLDE